VLATNADFQIGPRGPAQLNRHFDHLPDALLIDRAKGSALKIFKFSYSLENFV